MNRKYTLAYILGIIIMYLSFGILGLSVYKYIGYTICLKHIFVILTFFLVCNLIFHFVLIKRFKKNPHKFFQIFLLLTTVKIFIYLIFLVVYLFFIRNGVKCYLLSFLFTYLGFTIYETVMLSRFFKK
jgi:hypothetical protein